MPENDNPLWYTSARKESPLEQGDILFNCTIPILTKLEGVLVRADLKANFVVLNQSCDLIVQPKKQTPRAEHILLAEAQELELKEEDYKQIHNGRKPGLYVLPRRSRKRSPQNHLVVNFNRLYSMPSDLLPDLKKLTRTRICSPFREHLVQSFALTYSRIALEETPSLG